jgi:hypothetical protein
LKFGDLVIYNVGDIVSQIQSENFISDRTC